MSTGSATLISEYAGDPDMQDIIEIFVAGMHVRLAALSESLERGDREALESLAHKLNGAAGGFGFPAITAAGARLEQAVKQSADWVELRRLTTELMDLCARARAAEPVRTAAAGGG